MTTSDASDGGASKQSAGQKANAGNARSCLPIALAQTLYAPMPDNPSLPPELLRRIGAALYGEQWHGRLARELDVLPRTMRRWLSGEMPIPLGVADQLRVMVRDRVRDLRAIAWQLEEGETDRIIQARYAAIHERE
jgi:hypothetical protein